MKRIATALFAVFLYLTLSLAAFADGGEGTPPSPNTPLPTPPPFTDLTGEEGEEPPADTASPQTTDESNDNF